LTELLLARGQIAMLFAFPIVFAVGVMGMPILKRDSLSGRYRRTP
jgi:hypothetical protein